MPTKNKVRRSTAIADDGVDASHAAPASDLREAFVASKVSDAYDASNAVIASDPSDASPVAPVSDTSNGSGRGADALFVGSLEKGMRVLQAFGSVHDTLGLTEIAGLSGLGKSAAQRFVHTWERLGYLDKDARSRRYRLAPKVIELGYYFLRNDHLVSLAAPHLVAMRERCDIAVNLSVRTGNDMIYLLRLPSRQLTLAEMLPGRRMPAWCNSAGRMLLSALNDAEVQSCLIQSPPVAFTPRTETNATRLLAIVRQARADGYALAVDQVLLNQTGIAVIVNGTAQRPVAAISASADASDYPADRMVREVVPQLLKAANAIARG